MRSGYADAPVVAARITAGPTAVSWSAFWIARRWHDADSVSTAFRCPCINYAARMTSPSTAIAAAPRHLVPRSGENTHQKSRALPNRMVPRRRHTLDSGALGGRLHVRPTIAVSLGRSWLAHVPVELHSRRIRCTPNLGCCHLKGCAWRLIFSGPILRHPIWRQFLRGNERARRDTATISSVDETPPYSPSHQSPNAVPW